MIFTKKQRSCVWTLFSSKNTHFHKEETAKIKKLFLRNPEYPFSKAKISENGITFSCLAHITSWPSESQRKTFSSVPHVTNISFDGCVARPQSSSTCPLEKGKFLLGSRSLTLITMSIRFLLFSIPISNYMTCNWLHYLHNYSTILSNQWSTRLCLPCGHLT